MKKVSIFEDLTFNENRPAIKALLVTKSTKELRIAMKKAQIMKEHQTPFPIVVYVAEGAIDFGVQQEVHHLKKGDLVTLEGSVPHDLKAVEDSVVRLTLHIGDKTERVKAVVE